jgi:hypothetical protein
VLSWPVLSLSEPVPLPVFPISSLLSFCGGSCPQLAPTRRIRTRPVIPTVRLHDFFINTSLPVE